MILAWALIFARLAGADFGGAGFAGANAGTGGLGDANANFQKLLRDAQTAQDGLRERLEAKKFLASFGDCAAKLPALERVADLRVALEKTRAATTFSKWNDAYVAAGAQTLGEPEKDEACDGFLARTKRNVERKRRALVRLRQKLRTEFSGLRREIRLLEGQLRIASAKECDDKGRAAVGELLFTLRDAQVRFFGIDDHYRRVAAQLARQRKLVYDASSEAGADCPSLIQPTRRRYD